MNKLITQIPFPGFYESLLSRYFEMCEEQECENLAERDVEEQAPEMRLTARQYGGFFWEHMDYAKAHNMLAKAYVEAFNEVFKEEFEIDLGLEFESMRSPKEYNFTTDRVFAHIELGVIEKLRELVTPLSFVAMLKERFTPRDGFIPFYSRHPEDWDKPLEAWDHNELETLLLAFLDQEGSGDDPELRDAVIDKLNWSSPTAFDEAMDQCMNWDAFYAETEKRRTHQTNGGT